MVRPLHKVYAEMIKNFREEVDILVKKFKDTGSEEFKDFVPIWKELKFTLIYDKYALTPKKYTGSMFDFQEDTLEIAKQIMLTDHFLAGFFLLYGLFYVQIEPRAHIKLDMDEYMRVTEMLKTKRSTLIVTCQPGYIFARLLKNDAFHFVKFSRDYSMEGINRVRLVHKTNMCPRPDKRPIDPKLWLDEKLAKLKLTDKIQEVDKQCLEKKKKIKEDFPQLNLCLDMVPDDFMSGLQEYLAEAKTSTVPTTEDIGVSRRRLKNRKMKVKQRYCNRPTDSEEEEESTVFQTKKPAAKKKRGCPKGKRKHYFIQMVNEPDSMNERSTDSNPDQPKMSLNTID